MVGKDANRIRSFPFHSIRTSGTRRLSPSGRCRGRRPALSRFVPSPTINFVLSIADELRCSSGRVVSIKMEIRLRSPRLPAFWPVA
jgi:hypothetical protein